MQALSTISSRVLNYSLHWVASATTLTFILLAGLAQAQAPAVLNVSPPRASTAAPVTTNVNVRFTQPLSNTASTQQALKVFSHQAGGNKVGTTIIGGNTLSFNPTTDFKAGETVSATVTTAVQSTSGQNLATGQVVQFTTATTPSPGTFGTTQVLPANGSANNVVIGDIDGDGDLDFATTSRIFLNTGGGNFSAAQNITINSIYDIYNVTLGDVDNDGDLDLLVAYYDYSSSVNAHIVSIRLNNGQGVFTNGQEMRVGSYYQAPVLGDIDADGDLDLVIGNYNFNAVIYSTIAVRLNNGNGTFTNGTEVKVGGVPALGDIDTDGDLDLLVANRDSMLVNVLANNGTGLFSVRQRVTVATGPTSLALSDLDGDGDLDFATSNADAPVGVVSVRLNNGSGLFGGGSEVTMAPSAQRLMLGDLDGDGDADLVTANQTAGLSVRFNNGSASFSGGSDMDTSGNFIRYLATGDVDGDGDLDIVTTSSVNRSNTLSVYRNQSLPTITRLSRTAGPAGVSVTIAGTSFLGAASVTFNGVSASFTQVSTTLLSVVVPAGATTGPVVVTTGVGSSNAVSFTVTQDLDIVAVLPARNALTAVRPTSVAVTFNKPLSTGFDPQQALKIFSQQLGGRKAGNAVVSGNTLSFDPTTDFVAGETVFATVTPVVQSSTGQALVRPQVFQFTTATVPSTGSFSGGSEASVNQQPSRIAVGDIDSDGDQDLLTTSRNTTAVRISLNDGNGTFSGTQSVSMGAVPTSLVLGDLDGDGDLDIVASSSDSMVSVRLNMGNGSFGSLQVIRNGTTPSSVVLGDVDGDGDLDLLTTGSASNNVVTVNLNNGNGTFATGTEVGAGPYPFVLKLGDIDNDGDLDLVTANIGNLISIRLNDGNGNFSGTQQLTTGLYPAALSLGDIDADGDLDLLVLNNNSPATVSILTNDGLGTFGGNQQVTVSASPTSLVLGDIDGDGDLDLLTSSYGQATTDPSSSRVSIRFNNGSGIFGGGTDEALGARPLDLTLRDVDNDGDLDLLMANDMTGPGTVSVRLNQGMGLVVSSLAPMRNARSAVRTAPVVVTFNQALNNGPATQAALKVFSSQAGGLLRGTATVSGNTLSVAPTASFKPGETVTATLLATAQSLTNQTLANPQVFQFRAATAPAPGTFSGGPDVATGGSALGVAVGDVDGDGDLDLVTATSVRLNDGVGNFTAGASISTNGNARGITLGDVDNDGDLDLLVAATRGNGFVNVRLNNGQGVFSGTQQVPVGLDPSAVAVGDVDGDGDLDLLSTNYIDASVTIQFNNGNGIFGGSSTTSAAGFVAVAARPVALTLGDIDNDGDLDIVVATSLGNTVSVRFNNGSGRFSGNQEVSASFNPHGVALGDIDGDGDLDLLTANLNNYVGGIMTNSVVTVRINDGNGTFSGNQEVSVGRGARSVVASDVDGDGDLDMVVANSAKLVSGFSTVSIRLNNGAGSFTGTQEVEVGEAPLNLAVGDLDGDGDVDLVTGNSAVPTASVRLNQVPVPATALYRLNAGGLALQTSRGLFAADQFYGPNTRTNAVVAPIAGTNDQALYQSERYSMGGVLSYALPVPNGTYNVVLHFAEIYWTQGGQRIFNIELEGNPVRTYLDILAKVGPLAATTETYTVTVTDGLLNVDLRVVYDLFFRDQAKLSALEVLSTTSNSRLLATQPVKTTAISPLTVYPNPTTGRFTLTYASARAQTSTLTLVDQVGRTVYEQTVQLRAGLDRVTVQHAQLQPGLYQLVLRTADGQRLSQKVLVQP